MPVVLWLCRRRLVDGLQTRGYLQSISARDGVHGQSAIRESLNKERTQWNGLEIYQEGCPQDLIWIRKNVYSRPWNDSRIFLLIWNFSPILLIKS